VRARKYVIDREHSRREIFIFVDPRPQGGDGSVHRLEDPTRNMMASPHHAVEQSRVNETWQSTMTGIRIPAAVQSRKTENFDSEERYPEQRWPCQWSW
jgi:hypothetical protein